MCAADQISAGAARYVNASIAATLNFIAVSRAFAETRGYPQLVLPSGGAAVARERLPTGR